MGRLQDCVSKLGFDNFRLGKSLRVCPLVPPAPLIIKSSVDMTPEIMDEFRRYLLRVCYDEEAFQKALESGQLKFDKSSMQKRNSIGSVGSVDSVSLRIPNRQGSVDAKADKSSVAEIGESSATSPESSNKASNKATPESSNKATPESSNKASPESSNEP